MEKIERIVEKMEDLNPKVSFDFWVCVIFGNVPGSKLSLPDGYYWDEENSMISLEGYRDKDLYSGFLYKYTPYCEKEGEGNHYKILKKLEKMNPKGKFEFVDSKLIVGSVLSNELSLPVGYYWKEREEREEFTDKGHTKFGWYNTFSYRYKPAYYWFLKKAKEFFLKTF